MTALMRIKLAISLITVLLPLSSEAQARGDGWSTNLYVAIPGTSINYRHFTTPSTSLLASFSVRRSKSNNEPIYNTPGYTFDVKTTSYIFEAGTRHYGNKRWSHMFSEFLFGVNYFDGQYSDIQVASSNYGFTNHRSKYVSARARIGGEYQISDAWYIEAKYGFSLYRLISQSKTAYTSNNTNESTTDTTYWRLYSSSELNFVYYF